MAASRERLSPELRKLVPWTLLSFGTLGSVRDVTHIDYFHLKQDV